MIASLSDTPYTQETRLYPDELGLPAFLPPSEEAILAAVDSRDMETVIFNLRRLDVGTFRLPRLSLLGLPNKVASNLHQVWNLEGDILTCRFVGLPIWNEPQLYRRVADDYYYSVNRYAGLMVVVHDYLLLPKPH